MKNILNLSFYKQKGFYVSLASIILLLVANVCYLTGFTGLLLEYNDSNVMLISVIGILAFFVLLLLKYTSNYSPIVLWMVNVIAFLSFILNIYKKTLAFFLCGW